ncbi:MAG: L,D-transpeptidase [Croceibacterium sp.]
MIDTMPAGPAVAHPRSAARTFAGFAAGCLIAFMACAVPAAAQSGLAQESGAQPANFGEEVASVDAHKVADWIVASGDNQGLPFLIVDKSNAKVFQFDAHDEIQGAAPALLGLGHGDDSVPGIGHRRLATITNEERTTAAGRFEASLGNDFEQDVLWIDYDAGLSLHRVIVGKPAERRHARLASPTSLDNRISYGCINVPVQFYDSVVVPAFSDTVGIVYILPETRPLEEVFAMGK